MHTEDITCYQHSHLFHYSGTQAEKRTMRVVLLTVSMMIVEIVAGWIYNSMALFADGWHMSTHAAALGISWLAFVFARRYAEDRRFTFGTWKIEVLGGFVSGILLGLVGTAMAAISLQRLFQPVTIQFNQAIFVAVIGFVVNLLSIVLLRHRHHDHDHDHSEHHHHEHVHDNLNMRAAYLHVVADAMTSVLAIAALLGGKYFAWNWLDPFMGIVGAAMILKWTCSLLVETGNILLDHETDSLLAGEIRKALESDSGAKVSDLHVWKVGEEKYACIVAVVSANPLNVDQYKARLHKFDGLVHITVEIHAYSSK